MDITLTSGTSEEIIANTCKSVLIRSTSLYFWFKYDFGQRYMCYCNPSLTRLGFELITSKSWQYSSYHWNDCSNHSAISDFHHVLHSAMFRHSEGKMLLYDLWTLSFCPWWPNTQSAWFPFTMLLCIRFPPNMHRFCWLIMSLVPFAVLSANSN